MFERKDRGILWPKNCTDILTRILVLIFTWISFFSCLYLNSQEPHPFYTRLLNEGEKAFIAKNYKKAIKELEIAVFGLHEEKKMASKAYVYMGLSCYYLKDKENCETYIKKAVESIGEEGLESLELKINESQGKDLEELLKNFGLSGIAKKVKQAESPENAAQSKGELKEPGKEELQKNQIVKPLEKETIPEPQESGVKKDPIEEIEKKIQEDPGNISLYYALFDLHMQKNNIEDAKDTLQNLIKMNPVDINGRLWLAKIYFRQQRYKEAEENFEKILEESEKIQIDKSVFEETKAYLILCAHLEEDRKKAQKIFVESSEIFSREKIESLSLYPQDKAKLQEIIEIYGRAKQDKEIPVLTDIILRETTNSLEVEIHCIPYSSHRVFEIASPPPKKIVIDFFDLAGIKAASLIEVNYFGIKAIRSGMFRANIVRVVFDLEGQIPAYVIERVEEGLKIIIPKMKGNGERESVSAARSASG